MKNLALLVLLLVLLVMVSCPYCDKELKGDGNRALLNHYRFCSDYDDVETPVMKLKRDQPMVSSDSDSDDYLERQPKRLKRHLPSDGPVPPVSQTNEGEPVRLNPPSPTEIDDSMNVDLDIDVLAPASAAIQSNPDPSADSQIRQTRIRRRPAKLSEAGGFLPSPQYAAMSAFTETQPPTPTRSPSPSPSRSPSPDVHGAKPITAKLKYTEPNEFGLYRGYRQWPRSDPEARVTLDDLSDAPTFLNMSRQGHREPDDLPHQRADPLPSDPAPSETTPPQTPSHSPFSNFSVAALMRWFLRYRKHLSMAALNALGKIISSPGFKPKDLEKFDAATEFARMDEARSDALDDWKESSVSISLPQTRNRNTSEDAAPTADIPGLLHRDLTEVLIASAQDPSAKSWHWRGFYQFWKPPSQEMPSERVYGEVYTSDAHLDMEEAVIQGHDPDCPHEAVVVPCMKYSDASRLGQFGSAAIWVIYGWYGLLSKYVRAKPTAHATHHFAYIPSLPMWIQDLYETIFGKGASREIVTFLKRQLLHAIWFFLLDDKFINACIHGIVVVCADGVTRRLYPRFFTYSCDYPEKVLLTGIKYLGRRPCPLCLVRKDKIPNLGMKSDMRTRSKGRKDSEEVQGLVEKALDLIFRLGRAINSQSVKSLLDKLSLAPVRNAFASRFGDIFHKFNFYEMFPPDLMHDFELGTWKRVFKHLIRMCYACGTNVNNAVVNQLNSRYRQVPTFGRYGIRRFRHDVSAAKQLAAHHYEDLLQCSLPCFEGLFVPKHDKSVQDLLFMLAMWHALAKLRMHTDSSLALFDAVVIGLGESLRHFTKETCPKFKTISTPDEDAAKVRRRAAKAKKSAERGEPLPVMEPTAATSDIIDFNPFTFKDHNLGHYPDYIRRYGTTDNYSTQTGEFAHTETKQFWASTNKHEDALQQMTRQERRKAQARAIDATQLQACSLRIVDDEPLTQAESSIPYQMSHSREHPIDIIKLIVENKEDLAVQNFVPDLKDHLLQRLLASSTEPTPEERASLIIENNRIYSHQTLRINYTTYDVRRNQDSINPRSHSDLMFLASEEDQKIHPYTYARVVGVFHANVRRIGGSLQFQPMDFLWVRWYDFDNKAKSGFRAKRLHQVSFLDSNKTTGTFGFVNPADVVRAVHLIPRFNTGVTKDLLPVSIARRDEECDADFVRYYVNIFADRDMFMRFCGLGVGHTFSWEATEMFREDYIAGFKVDSPEPREGSDSEDREGDSDASIEDPEDDIRLNLEDSDIDLSEDGDLGADDEYEDTFGGADF